MSQHASKTPQSLEQHLQRAIALQKSGQLQQAYNLYRQLVQTAPGLCQAWSNMGHIDMQAGRLTLAEQMFRKALGIEENYSFALNGLGTALYQQNRLDEAIEVFTRALRHAPDDKQILCNLGILLSGTGRTHEALPTLEKAVKIAPDDFRVLFSLGNVYYNLERVDEAIEKYHQSLEINPDFALTKKLLANAFAFQRDFEKSFALYDGLEKKPDLCADYGWALTRAGQYKHAEEVLREGLRLNPEHLSCLNNLGSLCRDTGRTKEALEIYERAIDISPNHAEANYNYGITLIKAGFDDKGWHYHEWRWHTDKQAAVPPDAPCWDGRADLNGKILLIITDQGIGDVINFVRYAPLIKQRHPAAKIIIEVEDKLVSLLKHNYGDICEVRVRDNKNKYDLWTSFMALPGHFLYERTASPYLKAPAPKSHKNSNVQLIVGLSWCSANKDNGAVRSLELKDFTPLARHKNVKFIDLQYGDTTVEREKAQTAGLSVFHDDSIDSLKNIESFANQVAACDLVISIDNTTAHTAGALGIPVWTILPGASLFRWEETGEATHWYPSMRMFRTKNNVEEALERIFDDFKKFAAGETTVLTSPPLPVATRTPPKKTCILLNDTSAWYHWGCTATSEALQSGIVAKGYKFIRGRHQAIAQTRIRPPALEDFDSLDYFMHWRHQNPSLIWEIEQADIVMINGEGTIHRAADNALKLLYLAYTAKMHMRKRVHIVNHACFPEGGAELRDPAIQALYKKAYSAVDYVAVRDPASRDLLKQMGVAAELAFDSLPLTVRDSYGTPPAQREKRVIIAGSSAFSTQGAEALQQLLLWLKNQKMDAEVLLGARREPAADDRVFTETLNSIATGQYKIFEAKSMKEWLDRIATASLLVSGRFHYTIAAACLGTPFVALEGNTPKMTALSEALGQEQPLSYADPKLHIHLISRSTKALRAGPINEDSRRELLHHLCALAEKNFQGL